MGIFFKEYEQVKSYTGWGKMNYCFTDLDRHDSMMVLNYLIDTEPCPEGRCLDEGFEDYLQYSDSWIMQKIPQITNRIIVPILDDLKEHNYIDVHHKNTKSGKPNTKGVRYIKLNHDKIAKAMGISDLHSDSHSDSQSVLQSDSQGVQQSVQQIVKQNRVTEYQTNTQTDEQEKEAKASTSSSKKKKSFIASEDTKRVVDYFNHKMDTHYRYTKSSCELIQARLNEGFTVDDCITVIDKQVYLWGKNPEMCQHLNTTTLFRKGNFEKYLNTKIYKDPQKDVKRTVINKDNLRTL